MSAGSSGDDGEGGAEDERTRVLGVDELLALLERRAAAAAAAGVEVRALAVRVRAQGGGIRTSDTKKSS